MAVDLMNGLEGWWLMHEGLGTSLTDRSGKGWTGTLTGNTTGPQWVGGPRGRGGLKFNDAVNDRVTISTSFTLTIPLSVSAWVHPTDYTNYRNIFTKRNSFVSTNMVWQWDLRTSTGVVRFFQASSGGDFSYAPPLGVWTHLAVTVEAGAKKLYVNGALQQTISETLVLGTGTGATVQISGFNGSNELFLGSISDVRAWSRVLNVEEVAALYAEGLAFNEKALRPRPFAPGIAR